MKNERMTTGFSGEWIAFAVCALLPLLLSACIATPRTKFYVLSSMTDSAPQQQAIEAPTGLSIGVGPVKVPDYLDRPQIVTRSNPSTLDVADFDRWAEPLDSSVSRVLAENLAKLLGTENVAIYPWPPSNRIDYQVQVTLVRFDGTMSDKVALDARWAVLVENGKRIQLRNNSRIREPVEGSSFESLVVAQSRALADLSRDIASAVAAAASGEQ